MTPTDIGVTFSQTVGVHFGVATLLFPFLTTENQRVGPEDGAGDVFCGGKDAVGDDENVPRGDGDASGVEGAGDEFVRREEASGG